MRRIQFYGQQIKFPSACACCLKAVHKEYNFEQVFTYGRRSIILQLPVPLCHYHFQQASAQSPAQLWSERLGTAFGAMFGLTVFFALLNYWSGTQQGFYVSNLFLAFIIGSSMAVIIWAIAKFWVAPLFAFRETRAVLRSVQMKKFDPTRQILEIVFQNETIAELTVRENLAALITANENMRQYFISAHLVDEDKRWNGRIDTNILLDHSPSLQEAEQLLEPVIERFMIQQNGIGTFYEINDIKIMAIT